jgi:hypothetical protein
MQDAGEATYWRKFLGIVPHNARYEDIKARSHELFSHIFPALAHLKIEKGVMQFAPPVPGARPAQTGVAKEQLEIDVVTLLFGKRFVLTLLRHTTVPLTVPRLAPALYA